MGQQAAALEEKEALAARAAPAEGVAAEELAGRGEFLEAVE